MILSADAASLTLDGTAVTATPTGVPGRPDLAVLAIGTTPGSHTLQGASDFQLGLVTGAGGQAGLFAYYTPFRIPGCGDAVLVAPEGCDDGNLDDGDGCSSSCKIEISFTGCSASGDCVPAGRCDAGTCVARCNGSAECDDSNACTVDACDGTGACTNVAVAAGSAGTCTGGQVCTGAPANRCVQCIADTQCAAPTPHCDLTTNACITCTADAECDDLVECTADVCTAGSCGNTPVVDGLACSTGRCMSGACTTNCGDGIVASGVEACDDGNTTAGDGCSATCAVEGGWSCGCTAPTITYSMEAFAGRMGGDGGGVGPQQGCTGSDVLIGLSIEWSDGRGEAVRTTTICGSVSVSSTGVVSTTPTTRDTEGGSGCFGWDPSTASADVTCPDGWAIVGVSGEDAGGATLFTDLSIVCQQLGPDGSAAGPTMTLHVPGGGSTGSPQMVSCPAGHIARFFQTRRGCGQDALDLFCGVAAADCGGAPSICGTFCGDAVVGAPAETCDDAGESATCDADCTAAMCGDGTVNATAGETCDASGQSPTCDADCTDAVCGDGTQNTMAGESCDDGNTAGGDGCSATCVSETCGDATVQGTETCDDGGESGTCDADCTAATCGDGTRNTTAGEACDDGNATNGDGCSSTCAVETDAGMPDAGRDAGMPDAAMPDAAMPDAAMPMADAGADAGTPDVGIAGGACGCHAAGSGRGRGALGFGLLALATLILRRRSAIRRVGGRS